MPTPPTPDRIANAVLNAEVEADPKKPTKAITATVGTFIAAFVVYWVADKDPFTAKDAGQAFVSGLVASGLTGGATFTVKNPLRRKPPAKHRKAAR